MSFSNSWFCNVNQYFPYFFESEQQIDCKWGEYSPWSECSKSCGSGIRRRIRVVVQNASIGGKECTGLDKEAEECKILDCRK